MLEQYVSRRVTLGLLSRSHDLRDERDLIPSRNVQKLIYMHMDTSSGVIKFGEDRRFAGSGPPAKSDDERHFFPLN